MLDPTRLLRTLHKAAELFRSTPGRRGRFVELKDVSEVLMAGDLHGNLTNFKKILDRAELPGNPKRHLIFQELIHELAPAAGIDQSHRLLDLLAALKCQFPERVHMLMGNHELSQWTGRDIMKGDDDLNQLFRLGIHASYSGHADEIYAAYRDLFAELPLALRTLNRVFLSHSLPGAARLDQWELSSICKDTFDEADYKLGGVVHALVWGRDTSPATAERFLHKVDADWLITGHIPCEQGFQTPSDWQIILDSSHEKGYCCLFPADRNLTQQELLAGLIKLRD